MKTIHRYFLFLYSPPLTTGRMACNSCYKGTLQGLRRGWVEPTDCRHRETKKLKNPCTASSCCYWNVEKYIKLEGGNENTTGEECVAKMSNCVIDCFDDTVFLWSKNQRSTYTDRANVMKPILEMPIWSWHWKADGRIGAVVKKAGKEAGITGEPYVYQLRWAAEFYGARANCESIAKALRNMREDFQNGKYNLDHLDNNFRNGCLWNLAKMTRSQNATKQNLTAKIRDPYFWFSVNAGSGYRILCGHDADNPRKIFCGNIEDYLEYLYRFSETGMDSTCPPKEIKDGGRLGYDSNGTLTDFGERMIKYLRVVPDTNFERF